MLNLNNSPEVFIKRASAEGESNDSTPQILSPTLLASEFN